MNDDATPTTPGDDDLEAQLRASLGRRGAADEPGPARPLDTTEALRRGGTSARRVAPTLLVAGLAAAVIASLVVVARRSTQQDVHAAIPGDALAYLQSSADRTLGTSTYRVDVSTEMAGGPAMPAECAGNGWQPNRTWTAWVDGSNEVTEGITTPGGTVASITDFSGKRMWLSRARIPGAPPGPPWVAVDEHHGPVVAWLPDRTVMMAGLPLTTMGLERDLDPRHILESLRSTAADVQVVGTEDAGGETATRVRIRTDPGRYHEFVRRLLDESMAESSGTTMPPEMPPDVKDPMLYGMPVPDHDVWVDGQGLVRRIRSTTTIPTSWPAGVPGSVPPGIARYLPSTSSTAPSPPVTLVLDWTFSDDGSPPPVALPLPESDVASIRTLPASVLDVSGGLPSFDTCFPDSFPMDGASKARLRQQVACRQDAATRRLAGKTIGQLVDELGGPEKLFELQNSDECDPPWLHFEQLTGPGGAATPFPDSPEPDDCMEKIVGALASPSSPTTIEIGTVPEDCLPLLCSELGILQMAPDDLKGLFPDLEQLRARCTAAGLPTTPALPSSTSSVVPTPSTTSGPGR